MKKDFHLAKRYYDMALETSLDAYLPATLSLISLYARSAYNAILGADDDLKSLSLFARPPLTEDPERAQLNTPPPPGGSVQPWSFNRAWREIQRRWGLDPGPQALGAAEAAEGEVAPGGGQRTDAARELELAEAQRALEGNGDQGEWGRRGREGGMDEEDDDEFWILEGDGDFTGTVAIVLLCGILGYFQSLFCFLLEDFSLLTLVFHFRQVVTIFPSRARRRRSSTRAPWRGCTGSRNCSRGGRR